MDPNPIIDFKCQQALEAEEKKVQILTQKLNASLEALLSKEAMVKQHAKVAEEAVAGLLFFISFYFLVLKSCSFKP